MTFEEILDQAIAMLQRRGRVTYQTLKLQFQLDEDYLEDLKEAILYAHAQVIVDDGRGSSGGVTHHYDKQTDDTKQRLSDVSTRCSQG